MLFALKTRTVHLCVHSLTDPTTIPFSTWKSVDVLETTIPLVQPQHDEPLNESPVLLSTWHKNCTLRTHVRCTVGLDIKPHKKIKAFWDISGSFYRTWSCWTVEKANWILLININHFLSIYEKLVSFCSINETGTNYPPVRGALSFYMNHLVVYSIFHGNLV